MRHGATLQRLKTAMRSLGINEKGKEEDNTTREAEEEEEEEEKEEIFDFLFDKGRMIYFTREV